MEFTGVKPQRPTTTEDEEFCTNGNAEMNTTAYAKLKTYYSYIDRVIKRELERNSTSDIIELAIERDFMKEESKFGDECYMTPEVVTSSSNNYTAKLQAVAAQFEINQPNHTSHEIKTEIPYYFTDSMKVKNEIDHETSQGGTTEVNANNIELDANSMQVVATTNTDSVTTSVWGSTISNTTASSDSVLRSLLEQAGSSAIRIPYDVYKMSNKFRRSNDAQPSAYEGDTTCLTCHKQFATKGSLKRHVKNVHDRRKDFLCSLCGHTFSEKHHLNQHVVYLHERRKAVACPICDRKFTVKSNCKRHIKRMPEKRKDCGLKGSESIHQT